MATDINFELILQVLNIKAEYETDIKTIDELKNAFIIKARDYNLENLCGVLTAETINQLWTETIRRRYFFWDNFEMECMTLCNLNFREWFYCKKPNTFIFYKYSNLGIYTPPFANMPIHSNRLQLATINTEQIIASSTHLINEGVLKINEPVWIIVLEYLDDIYKEEFWKFYYKQYVRDSQFYSWRISENNVSMLLNKLDVNLLRSITNVLLDDTVFMREDRNIFDTYIKKIYVLSVHSEDRSLKVKNRLSTLGITTEIVSFTEEDQITYNNLLKMFSSYFQKYACSFMDIKKLSLFLKIHKKEFYHIRNVMILYDDVVFCKSFESKLDALLDSAKNEQWDCMMLNERYNTLKNNHERVDNISYNPIVGNMSPFDALIIKSNMIKKIVSMFELTPVLFSENIYLSFSTINTFVANINLVHIAQFPQISMPRNENFEDSISYFYTPYEKETFEDIKCVFDDETYCVPDEYRRCCSKNFDYTNDSTQTYFPKIIHRVNLIDRESLTDNEMNTYNMYEKSWLKQNTNMRIINYSYESIRGYRTANFPRWEYVISKTQNKTFITLLYCYIMLYETGGMFVYDNHICHSSLDSLFNVRCQAILSLDEKQKFCEKTSDNFFEHPYKINSRFLIAKKNSEFVRALIYHLIQNFHLAVIYYEHGGIDIDILLNRIIDNSLTSVFFKYWKCDNQDLLLLDKGHVGISFSDIRYSKLLSIVPIPLPARLIIKNKIIATEIDVYILVKNNAMYLKNHFWKMMDRVENSMPNVKFNYYIYENDSVDNTLDIVMSMNKRKNINLMSKKLGDLNNASRTYRLGIIRNELSDYLLADTETGKTRADLVLLIDTDIIFTPSTIHQMIRSLIMKKDAVMIGSHCLGLDDGYYDTLALEMGKYHLTRPTFLSYIGSYLDDLYPVSSCFGGICVTYKHVFNYCHFGQTVDTLPGYYSNITCEHYNFCRNLKSFGNIYICKSAISYWVEKWSSESEILLEKLRITGFYY